MTCFRVFSRICFHEIEGRLFLESNITAVLSGLECCLLMEAAQVFMLYENVKGDGPTSY